MTSYADIHSRSQHADRDAAWLDLAMQRYAAGDAGAFGELYAAVAPALQRFCLRLTRRRDEASDVFQDALLRLHRARSSYVPGSPTMGWMYTIARSSYLDRLRRGRRRPTATVDLDTVVCGLEVSGSAEGSPEAELCARDLLGVVDWALGRMSEGHRKAYVLQRDGLSIPEVAEALGTSRDVAKQRAHRAGEEVREALRRAGWSGRGEGARKMSPAGGGDV